MQTFSAVCHTPLQVAEVSPLPITKPASVPVARRASSYPRTDGHLLSLDLTDLETRSHDGSHLTGRQAAAIEKYVRRVLKALDLSYWRVHVARDLPPEDALLMIDPVDGRRIATLYVSERWWDEQDAEEKRTDLVHECLHLAHHDQEEVIRRFRRDNGDVGDYPMSIVWSQFKVETERMVDSLSYVIAPFMPPWKS